MIKFGVQPLGRLVTSRTIGTHGFFVRQVFFVAIHAVSRRLTMLFIGRMAVGAFGLQMRTGQVEVGECMIKQVLVEDHNDRIATFVLSVTA